MPCKPLTRGVGNEKPDMTHAEHARLFVAVGGASSSGKTRVLRSLKAAFGARWTAHLDLDGYHKHDREQRRALGEFPEESQANDFARIAADLRQLRDGVGVKVPTYDHTTGCFGQLRSVKPCFITFVEGLHAVALNTICGEHLTELSILLDPEEDLRRSWKVHRDVSERSYTYDAAVSEVQQREPFVRHDILAQRELADIVVHITPCAPRLPYHTVLVRSAVMNGMRLQRVLNFSSETVPQVAGRDYGSFFAVEGLRPEQLLHAIDACPFDIPRSTRTILSAKTRAGSYQNAIRQLAAIILATIADGFMQEETR